MDRKTVMHVSQKYSCIRNYLRQSVEAVVALSGGVDSSFLLAIAREEIKGRLLAFTIDSPYIPDSEIRAARDFCGSLGLSHRILHMLSVPEEILNNPSDRCYHCKKHIFSLILSEARKEGIAHVFDGTNADETGEYRPGLRALLELGIESPLAECGFSKNDIRMGAREGGIRIWDKPSCTCLLTRLPYDKAINLKELSIIEKGEELLHREGFRQVRLRLEGENARIEVAPEEREKMFNSELMDRIAAALEEIGFKHMSLDLRGYRRGSMDDGRSMEQSPGEAERE